MFIQTKCNELSFADLIRATKDTTDESKKFPYKTFVARCGNCQFCYKGKCSLKECCCMGERVKAGSCSFTELFNHCFRNIGDNVFRFRLRIAAERAAEEHSCFLSKEHFKRFREGCALTHRNDNGFIAQLFLLSAEETLWKQVSDFLFDGKFSYGEVSRFGLTDNAYTFFCMAYDLENGTSHTDIGDLSDDEVVDFDVFRMVCNAVVIRAYGFDAIRIAGKRKKEDRRGGRNEKRS